MSIFNRKKLIFIAKTLIFCLFLAKNASATIGYEEETNHMISTVNSAEYFDIGDDIMYYDFSVKKYRNGFIEFRDSTTSGTKIIIRELETGKKRVFLLDYD